MMVNKIVDFVVVIFRQKQATGNDWTLRKTNEGFQSADVGM